MSVYVDDLWYRQKGSKLTRSCHLMADDSFEMDAFAKRLGLKKRWRHGDHYDLVPLKRAKAVLLGAIEITTRDMAKRRMSIP